MSSALKFSEAFALGLHATALIAKHDGEKISVTFIAKELGGSVAHLQKVLQRLGKAGIISSTRGPKGGYLLAKKATDIKMLDIFEIIEGKIQFCNCVFDANFCNSTICLLGPLTSKVNREIFDHFSKTTIAELIKKLPTPHIETT